ncbi:helix-turn-helix domain-containing protein [Patescibacteria group bacterium]|nr:helix-turn-helix domain-containing protein [Patescibacteria group bacterium]MCG2701861.1 helix-turn-helix domain-containing protein [Candidatus Parcubacteria bacterium]MBU4265414.1 helix-turn-helix domain-containing protein [Patescibacteria group bacterium]MBU4390366.1 helix-turn-helix domain-containing protein [Patescibacteria group bacterium]MBU4396612.1 helix-turn-helix domain-containing protein [Patescibacteria group bacterium]
MNQIYKTLSGFGLTKNEIKVYLQTLKENQLSPYKISKLTKIPRTTVYDILMNLSFKGLIKLKQSDGFTKQQTTITAKNPSVLRDILWKKRKKISNLELDIVDILPQLKGDFHKDESNADFKFYSGIKGAKKVYLGELDQDINTPILAFENLMPMDIFGRYQMNKDVSKGTKQSQKNIKEIITLNDWAMHVISYQFGRDPNYIKTRQIRTIDNPIFSINQRIAIQDNRIRITTAKDSETWGLIIKSPSLAKTLASIFHILWSQAVPLTKNIIDSWGPNQFLLAEISKKSTKSK